MTKTFKILSAISFIALALALTFVGVWALTDLDFTVGGDITYTAPAVSTDKMPYLVFTITSETNKTCSVKANSNNKPTGEVKVPSTILISGKEYSVTEIAEGEEYTYIHPYSGEQVIGYRGAFEGCNGLTQLVFPANIASIPDNAFKDCTSLESIELPKNVTGSIGDDSFKNCYSLTDLTLPVGITTWGIMGTFTGCSFNTFTICGNMTLTLDAFYGASIKTLIILADVSADAGAMAATGLQNVIIGDGVTNIPDNFLSNCSSLISISIPDTVSTIGKYAFDGCDNLAYNLYSNAKYLGNDKNPYVVLTQATSTDISTCAIKEGCKVIAATSFKNCTSLNSITIPDGLKRIQDEAFYGCTALAGSMIFPDSLISIGSNAFYGCSGISGSLLFPDNLINIGSSAFYGCSGISGSLLFPDSLINIGSSAFYGCSALSGSLSIPKSLTI